MTDPLSIIASTIAIADATRSVIAACSDYLKRAKSAPKDLQVLVEDLEDLNVTIRKLNEIVRSDTRSPNLDEGFGEWKVPLDRLTDYSRSVKDVIEKQDLRVGRLHEIAFRALWPMSWRSIQSLLGKIDKEKNKLHFATAIEGVGISKKIYMLVESRIISRDTYAVTPEPWRRIGEAKPLTYFLDVLGHFLDWRNAIYDYPGLDDTHQRNLQACAANSCDFFLGSPAYLGWKNRKTPGPSLLQVTGSAGSGKSILCSQIIKNLQETNGHFAGITYYRLRTTEKLLEFCIMQLAFQAQSLPVELEVLGKYKVAPGMENERESFLIRLLISILPSFRRTYILLDDMKNGAWEDEPESHLFKQLLEQELGNVSIAVFRMPPKNLLEPPIHIPDVSIRLLKVEYRAEDISKYVDWKLQKIIKPDLDFLKANIRIGAGHKILPTEEVLTMIRESIVIASDSLYLAADMFIDSTHAFIRTHSRHEELQAYLREIRESSEVMLQRDPQIMKQKNFLAHAPDALPDYPDDSAESEFIRKQIAVGGGGAWPPAHLRENAGEGSSRVG